MTAFRSETSQHASVAASSRATDSGPGAAPPGGRGRDRFDDPALWKRAWDLVGGHGRERAARMLSADMPHGSAPITSMQAQTLSFRWHCHIIGRAIPPMPGREA